MNKTLLTFKAWSVTIFTIFLFSSCQKMDIRLPNSKATEKKSIARIVSTAPNFGFLEAALIKAGLAETLDMSGTFTIFAPTDDAFKAAGFPTAEAVTSADADVLKSVLLYHALGTAVSSSAAQGFNATPVTTLSGKDFYVTGKDGSVWVNNAKVIGKDVMASNGIIHVIDKVLMPPTQDLVQLAQSNANLSVLVAAVIKAGAVDLLKSAGPYTVFAPTNKAFEDLLQKLGFASLNEVPNDLLLKVLQYHVLQGRVFSYQLSEGLMPATLETSKLTISLTSGAAVKGELNTTPSNILTVDILATNGVVHVIDQVLLPD